ncbi:glycosyltransferase family 2 protein [Helicovermis profundi]|uniref:Glycosyltransferase family 2 protein n=1 Tax=Helicovermis profundi TaxID=3065157 RepID=A0AAU9E971_9FIRM|nr:glycosyltransferase family 2 protein [Clostridia bacterium S502]
MRIYDYIFLFATFFIWFLLFMNIILTYQGYRFYLYMNSKKIEILKELNTFPTVSILIPAHNEDIVIKKTVLSMLEMDYPKDRYEVVVINDNSTDNTESIVISLIEKYKTSNLRIVNVPKGSIGSGKSNTLNYGLKTSNSEYIAVYDADNTPNKFALRYLMHEMLSNNNYGAVIGKFRTRNKNKNILTKFINLETLTFQWMAQAGRWKLLKLCTIPGTNFLIRKNILDKLNGWDTKAIAEDTEISFRIYSLGYKISFMPLAETYEQEPETLKVWFKQRTRWVEGNIYVLRKYILLMLKSKNKNVFFDIIYFFSVYITFLTAVILSDILFLLLLIFKIKLFITYNFILFWILSFIVFILQVSLALSFEKGENYSKNILLILLMYFTYCQMWVLVSIKGTFKSLKNIIFRKESKWYKTERF